MAGMKGKFTRIDFKMYGTDCKEFERVRVRAPQGQYFNDESLDEIKQVISSHLNESFPGMRFEMVRVGRTQFNVFHHVGHA